MREALLALFRPVVQRGTFTLAGGRTSNYYIDGRLVTLSARGALLIGRVLLPMLRERRAQAVGGLTMGADPIAAAVAAESARDGEPIDAFLVRKEAKGHGTGRRVEGPAIRGRRVAVVDDVLTSGGSLVQAIAVSREEGAEVVGAWVLVDRAEGGRAAVEKTGVPLTAVFTISEVLG